MVIFFYQERWLVLIMILFPVLFIMKNIKRFPVLMTKGLKNSIFWIFGIFERFDKSTGHFGKWILTLFCSKFGRFLFLWDFFGRLGEVFAGIFFKLKIYLVEGIIFWWVELPKIWGKKVPGSIPAAPHPSNESYLY